MLSTYQLQCDGHENGDMVVWYQVFRSYSGYQRKQVYSYIYLMFDCDAVRVCTLETLISLLVYTGNSAVTAIKTFAADAYLSLKRTRNTHIYISKQHLLTKETKETLATTFLQSHMFGKVRIDARLHPTPLPPVIRLGSTETPVNISLLGGCGFGTKKRRKVPFLPSRSDWFCLEGG